MATRIRKGQGATAASGKRKQVQPKKPSAQPRATGEKARGKAKTATRKTSATPRLRVRMYRHGLGDCLLLRLAKARSRETFNILIDCGLISVAEGAKDKMRVVAEDIASTCPRLDVVVMTHEHWDHCSGFSTQQAREVFDGIDVGEVWYAWTEDPSNELGKRLRREREEKLQALALAAQALSADKDNAAMRERALGLSRLLGFFGADAAALAAGTEKLGKTREAFEFLMRKPGVRTRFCYPTRAPITFADVPGVRVYVLGPPENETLIKKSAPSKKDREVYELAGESMLTAQLSMAFRRRSGQTPINDTLEDCPFETTLRRVPKPVDPQQPLALDELVAETWNATDESYRRIEDDWTRAAETLALNLDSHTNNTCLVLAIELIDTGEVLLFPADAQVGNWLSWQGLKWRLKTSAGTTEVTGPDLLARTCFYKVGHHGSHNATLRALGLEQMVSEDLVAFIPVVKAEAEKNRWMAMPFTPLVKRLRERTGGRVLRADAPPPDAAALASLSATARKRFNAALTHGPDGLYFEYAFA